MDTMCPKIFCRYHIVTNKTKTINNAEITQHIIYTSDKCVYSIYILDTESSDAYSPKQSKELSWNTEYETPHSLNIRGVYLHILEHFFISIIVITNSVIVMYVDEPWIVYIDPFFTMLVLTMIMYSTIPLFRETLILFMQSVPANIKVKDIEERLMSQIPKILGIHEFHLWQLGGDIVVGKLDFNKLFYIPSYFLSTVLVLVHVICMKLVSRLNISTVDSGIDVPSAPRNHFFLANAYQGILIASLRLSI